MNELLWLAAGWWIGNRMGMGQPIVPPDVVNAPDLTTAAQNAANDAANQITGQAAAPPLVASSDQLAAGAGPQVRDTGLTVNGQPVCVDSFMNLVDCTTGQLLDDASAQVIINTLQQTQSTTTNGYGWGW